DLGTEGVLDWTPGPEDVRDEPYVYTVTATDGVGTTTSTFSITVTNTPPTISGLEDQTVHWGTRVLVTAVGEDDDDDPVTLGGDLGAEGILDWTPGPQDVRAEPYVYTVTANDGVTTTTRLFRVTVTNTAPTISGLEDRTVHWGTPVLVTAVGED